MARSPHPASGRMAARPAGFALICALAYAGGVIGYVPLLTLLLPMEVERIAGEARFAVLAAAGAGGAVAAGGANILFGWLSDRSRRRGVGRRWWIAAGLAGTLATFALLTRASTPGAIVAAVMIYQVALNALLGPLVAVIAEEVPDRHKGLVGGLFAAAPPIAALVSTALVTPAIPGFGARLAVIGLIAAACLMPLLATRARPASPVVRAMAQARSRRDLAVAWGSRLLVQTAGNVLFADLLYLMEAVAPSGTPDTPAAQATRVGSLLMLATLAPLPVSVALGRWSDRILRRKPFLIATAWAAAVGLGWMAAATDWTGRAIGFGLFAVGWGAFLPLQIGFIMEMLPDPDHRGRDLGIVNLANTLPVLLGQGLAWLLATPRHAAPLLDALALLTFLGGAAMLGVRGLR